MWTVDFESDAYSVPIGLGIGKVFHVGNTVANLFVEPQYSVLRQGYGQMAWRNFAELNFQFQLGHEGCNGTTETGVQQSLLAPLSPSTLLLAGLT